MNKSGSVRVKIGEFKPVKVEGTFEPSEVRPIGGWALKVGKSDENVRPNP